jgi:hydrophobe/amphiphile efflux-3 (HAE3) family protein
VRQWFARVAGRAVERPTQVVVAAILVALIGAVAALRLETNAGVDTLVDRGSPTYAATQDFKQKFGDDAVAILVKGDLGRLLETADLGRLLGLESCLSGTAPGGQVFDSRPTPEACTKIAALNPSHVVYGPATFLNQFAIQAQNLYQGQAKAAVAEARAAGATAAAKAKRQGYDVKGQKQAALFAAQQVENQFQQQIFSLGIRYGLTSVPRLDDPKFVSSVVFDSRLTGNIPKARFAYLFPGPDAALISIRLRSDLTEAQRHQAIGLFREAVADPAFKLQNGSYVVSGVPVVIDGLAQELSTQIFILLAAALAVMAATLALVFKPPLRLLPLAIALGAAAITFGVLSLAGGSLTMASIAVLPVLIGLAVDYAIQFQARFSERVGEGSTPVRAAVEAAAAGGPVIATAAVATGAGFLVLLLSPIPMVRSFGLLLVLGIAVAFALALTLGLAVLSLTGSRRSPTRWRLPSVPRVPRPPGSEGLARIGARLGTIGRTMLGLAIAAPRRVLGVALLLAVVGWIAGTQVTVISDLRQLVPSNLPALQNVDELEAATGVSGEVDVTVNAPDLTDPAVISWMKDFEGRVLAAHGFGGEFPSCKDAQTEVCPAIALPDLFGTEQGTPTRARIRQVLALLPSYFSQAVINLDPKTGAPGNTAVIAFGIKVMPFDEQERLINDIRSQIDPPGTANGPPPGVSAEVVGLPVLAADANSELESNRYLLTLAGLAAVALALLAIYRSVRRALIPLVPIVLATGWASLGLWAAGLPLNPMSATLGALVIAIATEFSVILSSRYFEERQAGLSLGEALRRTYTRTGAAVAASGVTAIAGFAVLAVSDVRMLRDFGLVTVLDLAVALVGVMVVLPATLVAVEDGLGSLFVFQRRSGPRPARGPTRLAARLSRR